MPEPQKYKLTARQKRMFADYHEHQQEVDQSVEPISTINSIESLYKALNCSGEIKTKAGLMLTLRNWLTEVSSFDPVSGHALYTGIVDFMNEVVKSMQGEPHEREIKDRIYRIVSHTKEAILTIMEHPRERILREHAMLPIHAAREVDSASVQWLSRQPGRTLREKLSGKPYMKAVRRRASVDTAENRLLKAFLFRMEQILIERQNALSVANGETCEELLVALQRWIKSEDVSEIGVWGNLPPNNTLLQDKRYRKIWDGWLWLQAIDEQTAKDSKRIEQDILKVIYWNTLSFLSQSGHFRIIQQPLFIDYDSFYISPTLPVQGYFFPEILGTTFLGTINKLIVDRGFGFVGDYFFHASELIDLHFDELQLGDQLVFDVEETPKGKCAKRLKKAYYTLGFKLLNNQIEISVGEKFISILIDSNQIILNQKKGIKKKIKIEPTALKEVPKTILSLVTDTPFEYFDPADVQTVFERMDSSVVDLCSIRPMFTDNTGSQVYLPFRLLQQRWDLNNNESLEIDCGDAKAVLLCPNIETVNIETISIRSLFSHTSTLPDAIKSSASMFFCKKLSDYISTEKLTYLVPDWANDFDLQEIRKSVNFYFEESTPLPKSIAALFAWQSSKMFEQDKARENDFVLVVDSFDGGISITPVQAIHNKKLEKILPETQGIIWERHPTFIVPNRIIYDSMARNLTKDGCQTSEELLQLFGFDGLVSDSGEISFVKGDHWYHLPSSIREILTQDLELTILLKEAVDKCLNSTSRDWRGINVFILPLEDTIKKPDLPQDYKWLGHAWEPVRGGQILNSWQEKSGEFSLWRDHLPKLSIEIVRDGGYENFYLVRDATVTPQRDRAVNIPVDEYFTLPAGPTHYSFPLQQGEGNKKLQFEAFLKSRAFPLKENTVCKLKMTYAYGADNPYELNFIPLDSAKAGFQSVRVEWRSVSEGAAVRLEDLPIPDFPARKSWSDFQNFPKKDSTGFTNLLDWCRSKLADLNGLISFDYEQELQTILNRRKTGYLEWGATDRTEKYYCRVNVGGESVFCHSSEFVEAVDESTLYKGCPVYLNVSTNEKGPFGFNISFSESLPSQLEEKVQNTINKMLELVEEGIFSLRFPALTIWNHGHSLSEADAPDHFRRAIHEGIQKSLLIIESESMPDTLKKELFFFLCCLHKDAPGFVGSRLLDAVKDKELLRRYHRNIAFAIGNAELPWQQQLLEEVCLRAVDEMLQDQIKIYLSYCIEDTFIGTVKKWGLIDKNEKTYGFVNFNRKDYFVHEADLFKRSQSRYLDAGDSVSFSLHEDRLMHLVMEPNTDSLVVLSIAIWRSKSLINRLTKEQLEALALNLYGCLKLDFRKVVKEGKGYQIATLCKHLELLLALLRSRGIEGEEAKMIFAPGNDLTKKYVTLVDDISKIVIDSDFELKSRISLQIEKPEMFRNTPDLLYALRMYLTGDSGANAISITGITDE